MTELSPGFIAVVDDDPRVLESLGTLLESADYTVRLFASATSLLESGCLAQIHCLISDIDMPTMDGLKLLQVVQAQRPELPIILITGLPGMLNRLPPGGIGYFRIFEKPFDAEELLTAISTVLRNPHPRIWRP